MRLAALLLLSTLLGCSSMAKLPAIEHRHWRRNIMGATLYNEQGEKVASFIGEGPQGSQICIFEAWGPCRYFETDELALRWLTTEYKGKP